MSVIDFKEQQKKLGKRTTSDAQSKQNTKSGKHGRIRTDLLPEKSDELNTLIPMEVDGDFEYQQTTAGLLTVTERSWVKPFSVTSKFARDNAFHVAIASLVGFITIELSPDVFGRNWMVTEVGIRFLQDFQHEYSEELKEKFRNLKDDGDETK